MRETSDSMRERSEQLFGELLHAANVRPVVSGGFSAGHQWVIRFPAPAPGRIKFFGVARGTCLLQVGDDAPVTLRQGDVFILTALRTFSIGDNLALPGHAALELFEHGARPYAKLGSDDLCALVGGHLAVDGPAAALLTSHLPAVIHIPAEAARASALRWLLEELVREFATQAVGARVAGMQLAQLLMVEVLRSHLPEPMRALTDHQLAPVLAKIHADPGRAWSVAELAKTAAMSRTRFAISFKAASGRAPLEYVTEWRMHLAKTALREGKASVGELAHTLGYGSESAFSNAFKRSTGLSPTHFRDRARSQ